MSMYICLIYLLTIIVFVVMKFKDNVSTKSESFEEVICWSHFGIFGIFFEIAF